MPRNKRRNSPAIIKITMICVRRMLSGLRKFSQRTLVEDVAAAGAGWLTGTPLAGCRRAPAKLNPGRGGIEVLYNVTRQWRNLPLAHRVVHPLCNLCVLCVSVVIGC